MLTIVTVCFVFAFNLTFTAGVPITHFGRCQTPSGEGVCIPKKDCNSSLWNLDTLIDFIFHPDKYSNCTSVIQDLICCPVNRNKAKLVELLKAPDCGRRLTSRITLGEDTAFDEFPWMALLIYTNGAVSQNMCGGVLISERHVLTAAHCISIDDKHPGYTLDSVRLGEWDVTKDRDCIDDIRGIEECAEPHLDIKVKASKIHPDHLNQRYQINDIAVIMLEKSVTFTNFIRPICLPVNFNVNDDYAGSLMEISGWGLDENASQTNHLMKAAMELWSNQHCRNINRRLNSQQLCAVGRRRGSSSCNGDSGGPLMMEKNGYYYTVGVISMGMKNCTTDVPVFFTKIDQYIDWIRNEMIADTKLSI